MAAKYDAKLKVGSSARPAIMTGLRANLKKQSVVEEFLDGSVKISYSQNALDNIVSSDMYTKMDFPVAGLEPGISA